MFYLSSAIAAILPMMIYLIIIWRFDRYDREPFSFVLINYLWGALGAIFLAIIGSASIETVLSIWIKSPVRLNHIETIIVAPYVEEITKGLFLFIIFTNRRFDNITDGLVYGGAIGLGFGMTENFLYFITFGTNFSEWLIIVVIRTLFSGVMHCVATAIFGAFLGFSKFKRTTYKVALPLLGLAIAIFIHFAWNLSVSFQSTATLGFLFMFVTVFIFITIFYFAILSEKKIIYNELFEESAKGLIPFEHLTILSSSKKNRNGWVDESIRKLYIRAATTLAFRKMELKNSSGSSKIFYEKDIEYYRQFISNLLYKPIDFKS